MGIRVVIEEYDDDTGDFINGGVGVSESSDVDGASSAFLKAYADSSFVNIMKIVVNPTEDRETRHTLFYNSHYSYYTLYYDDKESWQTPFPLQKTYLDGWEDYEDEVFNCVGNAIDYTLGVTDENLMVKPEMIKVGGLIPDGIVMGMAGETSCTVNIPRKMEGVLGIIPISFGMIGTDLSIDAPDEFDIDEALEMISKMAQDGVAYKGMD